jgi:S-disulfanyl-L-cysteine oxidoreductase SoxD
MRCSSKLSVSVIVVAITVGCIAALAQMPGYNGVGKFPTQEEIRNWDIAIGLDGKELPPGSGTAKEGAPIYAIKCAACHGKNLEGAPMPGLPVSPNVPPVPLAGGRGTINTPQQLKTVGSWWPFATTVWDFINRAMPRGKEGSLSANEVYALTALILYKNDIIKENDVLDAKTLPKVQMPNRNEFIPARIEDIHDLKKRGCRLGQCPESTNSK